MEQEKLVSNEDSARRDPCLANANTASAAAPRRELSAYNPGAWDDEFEEQVESAARAEAEAEVNEHFFSASSSPKDGQQSCVMLEAAFTI